jgi:hypothetical protein
MMRLVAARAVGACTTAVADGAVVAAGMTTAVVPARVGGLLGRGVSACAMVAELVATVTVGSLVGGVRHAGALDGDVDMHLERMWSLIFAAFARMAARSFGPSAVGGTRFARLFRAAVGEAQRYILARGAGDGEAAAGAVRLMHQLVDDMRKTAADGSYEARCCEVLGVWLQFEQCVSASAGGGESARDAVVGMLGGLAELPLTEYELHGTYWVLDVARELFEEADFVRVVDAFARHGLTSENFELRVSQGCVRIAALVG